MSFSESMNKAGRTSGNPNLARYIAIGCGLLLIVAVAFSLGTGIGFAFGRFTDNSAETAAAPQISAGDVTPIGEERTLSHEDMEIFWEAMGLLERDFYGNLPAGSERSYGAIRGVLDLLDDPNTSFMAPDQAKNFLESMDGSFEGIGATVEWVEDRNAVRLIEPFENQPAWNAGLRRNDLVIAIDGEPVSEMADLNEAISKIKGPKGSSVVLTVERPSRNETFDVTVVRDVIQIPIVFTDTYGQDKDIAYIRLSRFSDDASRRVRDAIDEATKQNLRGLVFDLRGNPGGLLREAVRVSSLFLQDERVLIERFSDGKEQFYDTEGRAAINAKLPIVLLVNEGSASASEIVAGALQDTGRAVLIGTTTFGKGSVQLPHTLSDGSMMRVTIARWYTPADRSIDGTGLDPDIEVEISDEQIEADEDPQLDRAIELLETGQ
ncbi:MAG: S41 family peptidase [Caldilineaceae bacterium]|nr:S41 family peptidase [Caldilineaceae bacterium]